MSQNVPSRSELQGEALPAFIGCIKENHLRYSYFKVICYMRQFATMIFSATLLAQYVATVQNNIATML